MAAVIVDDVTMCREAGVSAENSNEDDLQDPWAVHCKHPNDTHSRSLGGGNLYACNGMAIACSALHDGATLGLKAVQDSSKSGPGGVQETCQGPLCTESRPE